MTPGSIEEAARLIAAADGLLITAGAGMGVDSGLPDFRGREGFWRAYPALGRARIDFQEAASPDTFRRDPHLAWGFYGHRLKLYRDTVPHRGFAILRELAARLPAGAFVFTSNVDGQFQKAGFAAGEICEIHGSIHHLQCLEPCCDHIWPRPCKNAAGIGRWQWVRMLTRPGSYECRHGTLAWSAQDTPGHVQALMAFISASLPNIFITRFRL